MNTQVNFEIAKLLTEKGFDNETANYYNERGELLFDMHFPALQPTKPDKYFNAPTIAEVVMWLYEKHGIWIYTKPVLDEDGEWIFKGCVKHLNDFKAKEYQTKLLREPTGAYEAAIKHTLENLI